MQNVRHLLVSNQIFIIDNDEIEEATDGILGKTGLKNTKKTILKNDILISNWEQLSQSCWKFDCRNDV